MLAEALRGGGIKVYRCCRSYQPYWERGEYLAAKIYSHIALIVPSSDLAARSLSAKGELLIRLGYFQEAIQTYQFLLRRFPNAKALASDAYCNIVYAYLGRACEERENPDLLPLAKLTCEAFKRRFPNDERMVEVEFYLSQLEELCASCLYDMGVFYEEIESPRSAFLYYNTCMRRFPNAKMASRCFKKLSTLGRYVPASSVPVEVQSID
jgi:tetratricopeptide (TPR) repeat protein